MEAPQEVKNRATLRSRSSHRTARHLPKEDKHANSKGYMPSPTIPMFTVAFSTEIQDVEAAQAAIDW